MTACKIDFLLFICQDGSLLDQKKVATGEANVYADQSYTVFSPELKEKVLENKLIAKMKLTNKQTRGLVRDLGMSWYAALEPEFAKPYFQQVLVFIFVLVSSSASSMVLNEVCFDLCDTT